jgi:glucose/mannose transport system permease protein
MLSLNRDRQTAFFVILPSIILIGIFVYGFIALTAYLSMTDTTTTGGAVTFLGLKNFENLFTNIVALENYRFRVDIVNTFFLTVLFIAACLTLGLGLAILIDQRIRFETFFRTIFLFPMALSFVVTGTVWRWLFAPRSGLNTLLGLNAEQWLWFTDRRKLFGIEFAFGDAARLLLSLLIFALLAGSVWSLYKRRTARAVIFGVIGLSLAGWFWLGGAAEALAAVQAPKHGLNIALLAIVLAATWQMSGYTMAMYLAGLRGIPEELREAARVDGCNELQVYQKVVLPLLQPITLSAIIILGHISLKIFDLIYVMAGGDNLNVDVPGIHMYLTAFRGNKLGVGSAIAIVMLLLVALVIVPYLASQFRTEGKR